MTDQKISLESALAEIDAVLKADHFSTDVAIEMISQHETVIGYLSHLNTKESRRAQKAIYAASQLWAQSATKATSSLSPVRSNDVFTWIAAAKSSRRALKLTDRLMNPRHHEWFSQFSVYRRLTRKWDDQ